MGDGKQPPFTISWLTFLSDLHGMCRELPYSVAKISWKFIILISLCLTALKIFQAQKKISSQTSNQNRVYTSKLAFRARNITSSAILTKVLVYIDLLMF